MSKCFLEGSNTQSSAIWNSTPQGLQNSLKRTEIWKNIRSSDNCWISHETGADTEKNISIEVMQQTIRLGQKKKNTQWKENFVLRCQAWAEWTNPTVLASNSEMLQIVLWWGFATTFTPWKHRRGIFSQKDGSQLPSPALQMPVG